MKKPKNNQKQNSEGKNSKTKGFFYYIKRFWNFVWNDNSLASWAISILLAFIIIRFLFYPLLGLVMGTNLPVVAVISSSMEHDNKNWLEEPAYCYNGVYCIQEEWYLAKDITATEFNDFPFKRGFDKGDIMIIVGKKAEKIEIGDVIVFESGKAYPIIHRVVGIKKTQNGIVFETKGDNNPAQIIALDLNEQSIHEDTVKGVAKARIPYLGYIKIFASNLISGIRD